MNYSSTIPLKVSFNSLLFGGISGWGRTGAVREAGGEAGGEAGSEAGSGAGCVVNIGEGDMKSDSSNFTAASVSFLNLSFSFSSYNIH